MIQIEEDELESIKKEAIERANILKKRMDKDKKPTQKK